MEVESRADLRAWLTAHYTQSESVWLVTYKKVAGDRYLPYDAIVEEALAFGWVDSLPRELDEMRSMRLLSPRKPGSAWSKVNKARVGRLIAEDIMNDAGLGVVEAAKADGSWNRLDAVEALNVPPDLKAALTKHPPAAENFDAFPRSSKRLILEWILNAKGGDTRTKRIDETARKAAINERANHYRQVGKEA